MHGLFGSHFNFAMWHAAHAPKMGIMGIGSDDGVEGRTALRAARDTNTW